MVGLTDHAHPYRHGWPNNKTISQHSLQISRSIDKNGDSGNGANTGSSATTVVLSLEMKQEDGSPSRASGSRRTRSQISPEWTATDALILVNEIRAVEGDCQNALSSFQKWNIIADNCTILDVPRTSYQCRRKWESMRAEHNKIKEWESESRKKSFWSLGSERRKEFGLPENFDEELFKAIEDHVSVKDAQIDTDPDSNSDPETQVDVIEETEPKRRKQQSMPPGTSQEGNPLRSYTRSEEMAEERPQESCSSEEVDLSDEDGCAEEKEMMMVKLRENAEFIHAIVKGESSQKASGVNKFQDLHTDSVRRKGDAIIECLGDILNTLRQLPVNAQACDKC